MKFWVGCRSRTNKSCSEPKMHPVETHWLLKRATRVPAGQQAPWPPVPPQLTGVQSVFCSSRVEPAAHVLQVNVVLSKLAQLGTPPCGREAGGEGSVKGRPAAAQSFRQMQLEELPLTIAILSPAAYRPEQVASCCPIGLLDARNKAPPLDRQWSSVYAGWNGGSGPRLPSIASIVGLGGAGAAHSWPGRSGCVRSRGEREMQD